MAKITDPDNLNQGVEIQFLTGSRLIRLNEAGNLSADGVSLQAVYSFTKEEWRTDSNLIKFPFPFVAITAEQFELQSDWDFSGSATKNLIRDAGWALKDAAGNSREEYMNMTTLGTFDDAILDQAYYTQTGSADAIPTSSIYAGPLNEPIRIYASGAAYTTAPSGINDFTTYFNIFLREQAKTYDAYNLLTEQNLTSLTYRKYALPLSNADDIKITETDGNIATLTPYTGMSISYYTSSQQRSIGGSSYNFGVIINGNNGTAEQIYEFVQYSLRQATNINATDNFPAGIRGDITDELLAFIGDTLRTQLTTYGGVYIDNFQTADTNRLEFTDNTGTVRTFPFVAAGNLLFNENLSNDASARYWMFFTSVPTGSFGTDTAVIINNNSGFPITGSVNGSSSIEFDFDYDNNVQGGRTSGSNAAFTAVAIGLSTGQYVSTTGTITRSTSNVVNYVAALERNYANP